MGFAHLGFTFYHGKMFLLTYSMQQRLRRWNLQAQNKNYRLSSRKFRLKKKDREDEMFFSTPFLSKTATAVLVKPCTYCMVDILDCSTCTSPLSIPFTETGCVGRSTTAVSQCTECQNAHARPNPSSVSLALTNAAIGCVTTVHQSCSS
jgi:hypothetical protein